MGALVAAVYAQNPTVQQPLTDFGVFWKARNSKIPIPIFSVPTITRKFPYGRGFFIVSPVSSAKAFFTANR